MTKKPTWPKVWLEIAKAYYTPWSKRTARQRLITQEGLCNAINVICGYGDEGTSLGIRICCHSLNMEGSVWWWPDLSEYDIQRAQFAEHLAGLSHADFENFINGRNDD